MVWMDIVIVAVLVLSVIMGAKRGLLKSLAGIVVTILSFLGASWAANTLSAPVAKWLQPMLEGAILQKLTPAGGGDVALADPGIYDGPFGDLLQQIAQQAQQAGENLLTAVTTGIVETIAYGIVYLVAFLVLLLVLSLLVKPLQLATRLPGLHALNALGGGAFGLVWGGLLIFLAVWLMGVFQWVITPEMIDRSLLLKFFANNSPMSLLASL